MVSKNIKFPVWGSVLALLGLMVLLGLGSWQVKRLAWKQGVIQQIENRIDMPRQPIDTVLKQDGTLEDHNYTPVHAKGILLYEYEIRIQPRTYKGTAGHHLLTPLKMNDGGIIFVNRGWADGEDVARPSGRLEITGMTHTPFRPGRFIPDNVPETGMWYWADIEAMKQHMELDNVYPVILYAEKQGGDQPIGGQLQVSLPNNHLNYAIFWFGMAFILVVMYGLYVASLYRRETP